MDDQTICAYDSQAESIADLHKQLLPGRIYEFIRRYFTLNGSTLDVGCGIGRDTHWLNQNGYSAIGVDASIEMLKQAKLLYPDVSFLHDYLPGLESINTRYQNILCSAVLMHLDNSSLKVACERLLGLLNSCGVLIISYRSTNEAGKRENGKLYETIDSQAFKQFFIENDCQVLIEERETEEGRELTWHNWVIRK